MNSGQFYTTCRAIAVCTLLLAAACASGGDGGGGASTGGNGAGGSPMGAGGMSPAGGGPGSDALHWFASCGDPVCGPNPSNPNAPPCELGVSEGGQCTTAGNRCDANLGCGAVLVCAESDPKQAPGGCPISRARFKEDIEYLSEAERAKLGDDILGLPLATYRYREDPTGQRQLGFILEDVEPALFVDSGRDRVNLYSYTSMVVAALQEQQREVAALRERVEQLQSATSALRPCASSSGHDDPIHPTLKQHSERPAR